MSISVLRLLCDYSITNKPSRLYRATRVPAQTRYDGSVVLPRPGLELTTSVSPPVVAQVKVLRLNHSAIMSDPEMPRVGVEINVLKNFCRCHDI